VEAAAKVALFIVLVIPAITALVAVAMVWRGYVFSLLWAWFAVPIFGFAPLSIAQAIGVMVVVSFMTYHRTWNEAKDKDVKWAPFVMLFASPAVTLAGAWVVKQYM
jgi:hypothetical protein